MIAHNTHRHHGYEAMRRDRCNFTPSNQKCRLALDTSPRSANGDSGSPRSYGLWQNAKSISSPKKELTSVRSRRTEHMQMLWNCASAVTDRLDSPFIDSHVLIRVRLARTSMTVKTAHFMRRQCKRLCPERFRSGELLVKYAKNADLKTLSAATAALRSRAILARYADE